MYAPSSLFFSPCDSESSTSRQRYNQSRHDQALTTDNTIVMTMDGCQHSVSPVLECNPSTVSAAVNMLFNRYILEVSCCQPLVQSLTLGILMLNGVPIFTQVRSKQCSRHWPFCKCASIFWLLGPCAASTNRVNGNHAVTPTSGSVLSLTSCTSPFLILIIC